MLFFAKHAAVFVVLLATAAGAGTLVIGRRAPLALRAALGLAVWAHALFFLALIAQLRVVPIVVLILASLAGLSTERASRTPRSLATLGMTSGLLLLALYPPIAFDETMYHLPFVRAFAESGTLPFLVNVRFPVFPPLHELLCVPLFLLAGDVATHLLSVAEVMITAALLFDWGRRAGGLAAAFFLGSPIVVQIATVTYVDAALTLFVTAGFYCLDREEKTLSGFFFGTACSVKYLGGFFAVAGLVLARFAWRFAAACAAAALPVTLWITIMTGSPLFPFVGSSPWSFAHEHVPLATRAVRTLRLAWDVTFARNRLNFQPPVTPFLIAALVIVFIAARRDVRARVVAVICAVYAIVFAFLPQDTRYLLPLLPLIAIASAAAVPPHWYRRLAWMVIAPGALYLVYRLTLLGVPPSREAFLEQHIPAYRALMHAGNAKVYACGAEELQYYARGPYVGDVMGPHSYARVLAGAKSTSAIAEKLRHIDARYYLVAKRVCAPPQRDGGMTLVYEDEAAELWSIPSLR